MHHEEHSDHRHDAALTVVAGRGCGWLGRIAPASSAGRISRHHSRPSASPARRHRLESGTLDLRRPIHRLSSRPRHERTCIGIGGDPLIRTSFIDALSLLRLTETEAVVAIGEIGGSAERRSRGVHPGVSEAVVGFIAGPDRAAGPSHGPRRRHHRRRKGTAAEKMQALTAAGVRVVKSPADMGRAVVDALRG